MTDDEKRELLSLIDVYIDNARWRPDTVVKLDKIRALIENRPMVTREWINERLTMWNKYYKFMPITANDLILMFHEKGFEIEE